MVGAQTDGDEKEGCGHSSVVEHLVANENVARSNRVARLTGTKREGKEPPERIFQGFLPLLRSN